MKKSLTKNYIYNLLYQILKVLLPVITTPYISRVLGAKNIGIYSYTLSISAVFILFGSLGIELYGQREIAYQQDETEKYSKTFWEILIFRFISMTFSLLVFYFAFVYTNNVYSTYYKILMFEIIGNMFDISWFFQGLEEFKKTVSRNFLVKIISVACIFMFVKTKNDLSIYFLIYVFSLLLGNLSLWFYLPKYLTKVKKLNIIKHLKPTLLLFIPQIAMQIYTILDKTMLGTIIADKSEVGYYDQSQKIIKTLLALVTSLGIVMMPRIASTFAKKDNEKIKKYLSKSFSLTFCISIPMIFGIFAVSDIFVPIFFGRGYDKVALLMKAISPIFLFIGMSNIIGNQYLLPTKRQNEFTVSVIVGAVVNFCMNSILIPKYQALGASIGTVIAEFSVTLTQLIFVRKSLEIKEIIILCKNYVFSSIIMFLVCIIVSKVINNNFISLFVQIIAGVIVYYAMLILLKDKFVHEITNKIVKKLKLNKGAK